MIKNFSDHAANERTFLAWLRTGLAVAAFGFVIEKFNLFIAMIAESTPSSTAAAGALDRASRSCFRAGSPVSPPHCASTWRCADRRRPPRTEAAAI
jgi:hypothetical protein